MLIMMMKLGDAEDEDGGIDWHNKVPECVSKPTYNT